MPNLCEDKLCTGCGACASACPKRCITMQPDEEGFLRPFVDEAACVNCGLCQSACPILHTVERVQVQTVAYAAWNTDETVRAHSTSGGVFTLLCQFVLERGGAVFGAAYADDFSVVHCCVEKQEDIAKLRTAKYAQSKLGDSFKRVKELLEQGRYVLFSGTPCQIGGLQTFLGKAYERLLTVDLVCHGVPSPAVWARYVQYRSEQDANGEFPFAINLRSKETGWAGYSIRFDYASGKTYSMPNGKDPYLRCFVKDLCLRPSCYACKFKGVSRSSDFTLGDYWGVWSQKPELNDNKGTSIVLLHSEKAKAIWQQITPHMKAEPVEVERCFAENPAALCAAKAPEGRSAFLSRYQTEDFSTLVDELAPIPAPQKARSGVASLLHRAASKAKRMFLDE